MFIHNKVMCIQQQNTLAKIHPAASIAIAPFVSSREERKTPSDEDEHDVSSMESETHSPIKEALTPGKTLPVSNINRRLKHNSNSNSSSIHSDDDSVQSNAVIQKEVRFNQSVTARPSLHKNNYSADEFAATWYSSKEYDSIRRDLLKTLKIMQSGNFVECCDDDDWVSDSQTFASSQSLNSSSSHSFQRQPRQPQHNVIASARGLENFTAKGSLTSRVRKLREKAVLDVLVEQDFQVEQAESFQMTYLYYDAERIREVYQRHSKIASEAARMRGTSDYRAANGLKPLLARPLSSSGRRHSIGSNMRKMFGLPTSSSERSVKAAAAAVAASEKRPHGRPNRRWSLLSMPKTSKGLA